MISADDDTGRNRSPRDLVHQFWLLSRRILRHANQGVPRHEFMTEMSRLVLEFSDCDAIEIRLWGPRVSYRWQAWRDGRNELEMFPVPADAGIACCFPRHPVLEKLCRAVANPEHRPRLPCFTDHGSFWTGDAREPIVLEPGANPVSLGVADETRSLCLISFVVDDSNAGTLLLESARPGMFREEEIEHYEGMAQTLGLAIADRRAQAALRERVKELTCLYGIDRLVWSHGSNGESVASELLPGITEQVRVAFQYPDLAAVRVVLDEDDVRTAGWRDGGPRLEAPIEINGRPRGRLAVSYPAGDQGVEQDPFLPEEESLLEAVAREIAWLIGRQETEQEKGRLRSQLRHADRLATIGQLSAGIAHEINEPLANVLGFAQLVAKNSGLPEQARQDISRIEEAALHAREVIRKLMLFARQSPPRTGPVDVNELVRDGLLFLEGRCAKNDVELVRELARSLPEIEADSSQLLQVLINLVVNAIQAMPHGGRLTVRTARDGDWVVLRIEDTGIGMNPEIAKQIFLPFFTTKDIHEGTGLGLAVVDGIVAGHGGTIAVDSKVGVGSTFTVRLPRSRQGKETSND